jgi:hypothetical protein
VAATGSSALSKPYWGGKEKEKDVTNRIYWLRQNHSHPIKDALRNEGDGHRSNAHVNIHPLVSS